MLKHSFETADSDNNEIQQLHPMRNLLSHSLCNEETIIKPECLQCVQHTHSCHYHINLNCIILTSWVGNLFGQKQFYDTFHSVDMIQTL
jgi:hypothetical protein